MDEESDENSDVFSIGLPVFRLVFDLGVTIGYEMALPNEAEVDRVLEAISAFAKMRRFDIKVVGFSNWRVNNNFQVIRDFEPEGALENHKGEWPTNVKGVTLFIHPDQEKMLIVLGQYKAGWYGFGSVKTQFAPPESHKEIVSIIDELKRLGVRLNIKDDSDYYETRDEDKLERARTLAAYPDKITK